MTASPDEMRLAHRHRIELLIAGMLLARGPDRKILVDYLHADDFASNGVSQIHQAMADKNVDGVMKVLRSWGVRPEDSKVLSGSLLKCLKKMAADEQARKILEDSLLKGETGKDMRQSLEQALSVMAKPYKDEMEDEQ